MTREEKKALEIVKEFNLKNRYKDMGTINNAIDTVIRMAENSNESIYQLKREINKAIETLDKYKDFCKSRQDISSGMDIGAYQYKIEKLDYVLSILKGEDSE